MLDTIEEDLARLIRKRSEGRAPCMSQHVSADIRVILALPFAPAVAYEKAAA